MLSGSCTGQEAKKKEKKGKKKKYSQKQLDKMGPVDLLKLAVRRTLSTPTAHTAHQQHTQHNTSTHTQRRCCCIVM